MSVIKRPDGYYWKDDEDDREYGPFATLLEAGRQKPRSVRKLTAAPSNRRAPLAQSPIR